MTNRPATWLRITASDGAWGWGEVFSNFPTVGAEHRARLVESIFTPLLENFVLEAPPEMRQVLEARTRIMAIQCGEPGPFAQIIGAIDQALWDMSARRAGHPYGSISAERTRACGSMRADLDQTTSWKIGGAKRAEGFRKAAPAVGFGAQPRQPRDAPRGRAGTRPSWWTPTKRGPPKQRRRASRNCCPTRRTGSRNRSPPMKRSTHGRDFADTGAPLAAGENIRGEADFAAAINAGFLRFVQPDVGKWGDRCGAVARRAVARGIAPARIGSPAALASPHRCIFWRRSAVRASPRSTPTRIRCARKSFRWISPTEASRFPDAPGIGVGWTWRACGATW